MSYAQLYAAAKVRYKSFSQLAPRHQVLDQAWPICPDDLSLCPENEKILPAVYKCIKGGMLPCCMNMTVLLLAKVIYQVML